MTFDPEIAAIIAAPVIAIFVGVWLNRFVEGRPRLISYLAHASAFRVAREEGHVQINTHSLVLRNAGRKTVKNVRLGHSVLPDFQVFPDIAYRVEELPGGSKELVFPQLVPKKQVTVSYLYLPPVTWDQINTHIESEDGPGKVITVLPTPQWSRWLTNLTWFLIVYGVVGLLYTITMLIRT